MHKKLLLLLSIIPSLAMAQMPDWYDPSYRSLKFPSDKYFTGYSIRTFQEGEDIATAISKVEDAARVEAISSIRVHVENITADARFSESIENMKGFDETIIETFSTETKLTTDLEIASLHVDACRHNNEIIGFAYVKRNDVIRQFDKAITGKLAKLEIQLDNVDEMVSNGQKIEARTKLESLYGTFADIEADQKILLAIDEGADLESVQMPELKTLLQRYNKMMATLKNGINIYLDCKADLFGANYATLENTLKGELSKIGCSFVSSAADADWAIYVTATAREYNAPIMDDYTTYFAYIDATLAIDKKITNQRIYEDALNQKGGHTHNYTEAARDGYKQITQRLIVLLNQYIKQ